MLFHLWRHKEIIFEMCLPIGQFLEVFYFHPMMLKIGKGGNRRNEIKVGFDSKISQFVQFSLCVSIRPILNKKVIMVIVKIYLLSVRIII